MKTYRAKRFRGYRGYDPENYRMPRRYRRKRRSWTRWIVSGVALLLVVAGLGLAGYSLLLGNDALLPRAITTAQEGDDLAASAPKDTTLHLTVPKMARVEDLPVYNSAWDDETALDVSAGHLDSSGFPWEDGSNVYIAGHRMGFPGTKSFLVFYDLDVLEEGDEIFLTDSDGTKYSYEVFDKHVADPYDWSPTEPVEGKNVVTLQTCTLPDYTQRLIIQGELKEVTPGAESPREETGSSEETAPEESVPRNEIAPAVLPQDEVIPDAIPQGDIPPEAIPQDEIPPEAIPQDEVPPGAGLPQEEAAPQGAGLQEAAPQEAAPQGVAPPGTAV